MLITDHYCYCIYYQFYLYYHHFQFQLPYPTPCPLKQRGKGLKKSHMLTSSEKSDLRWSVDVTAKMFIYINCGGNFH